MDRAPDLPRAHDFQIGDFPQMGLDGTMDY
jgi:hypothetical protein